MLPRRTAAGRATLELEMLRSYCGATACHNSYVHSSGMGFLSAFAEERSDSKLFFSQVFGRQRYFFNADALGHLEEIQ